MSSLGGHRDEGGREGVDHDPAAAALAAAVDDALDPLDEQALTNAIKAIVGVAPQGESEGGHPQQRCHSSRVGRESERGRRLEVSPRVEIRFSLLTEF